VETETDHADSERDLSEDTSPVTKTVSSSHPDETWTKAQRTGRTKILSLKPGDIIRYRASESEEWNRALVTSRAGKTSGRYANTFNLQVDGSDDTQFVELTDKVVEKLTVNQNVVQVNDTGQLSNTDVR